MEPRRTQPRTHKASRQYHCDCAFCVDFGTRKVIKVGEEYARVTAFIDGGDDADRGALTFRIASDHVGYGPLEGTGRAADRWLREHGAEYLP